MDICENRCDFSWVVHACELRIVRWYVFWAYGGGFDKFCKEVVQFISVGKSDMRGCVACDYEWRWVV